MDVKWRMVDCVGATLAVALCFIATLAVALCFIATLAVALMPKTVLLGIQTPSGGGWMPGRPRGSPLLVTNDAFKTVESVLYDHVSIDFFRKVAFFTSHCSVFSIQFEPRFTVVKIVHDPVVEAVAPRTISHAAFLKLSAMLILVAGMTGSGEPCKFSMLMFGIRNVTSPAILLDVGTLQLESGFSVVESVFTDPAFRGVAVFASLAGVPFNVNFPHVYVFVAIHAALANFPELPLLFFPMAGITRRCNMRPGERKCGLGVFFKGKCTPRKPIHRMALRTVRCFYSGFKLPLVVVFVAGRTGVVR